MDMRTAPSTVQIKAVERAIQLLNAAHCEYAIRIPGGDTYGDLPIQVDKPKKRKNRFSKLTDYKERIPLMNPGDVEIFECPVPGAVEGLRSSICAYAGKTFGLGTYITTINGDTVELLRVE